MPAAKVKLLYRHIESQLLTRLAAGTADLRRSRRVVLLLKLLATRIKLSKSLDLYVVDM